MATNLAIDQELLESAQRIGDVKTKRETVNIALAEFISRRRKAALIDEFGTFEYDEKYDYKKHRRSRG